MSAIRVLSSLYKCRPEGVRTLVIGVNPSLFTFELCVLAKLFPAPDRGNPNRPGQYRPYQGVLKEVQAPIPLDTIGTFEEANFIAVNVYELNEDNCIGIKRASTLIAEARESVNLLYIENVTSAW